MTESPHETVVVGVDGSAASAAAVRWAAAEAARRQGRLHAVHVVDPGRREDTALEHDTRRQLELARRTVPGRVGGWVFSAGIDVDIAVSVVTGSVARQLTREAHDAALVGIGSPSALHRSQLPAELAVECLCPVAVVGTFGDVVFVEGSAGHLVHTERASRTRM
jgi:nucleotide-binding universal stress UspA family protein